MATSSAMSTSNQYIKYKIEIVQNSRNISKNTSNVTVSVRVYRTNTGYTTYGTGTVYCTIDGKEYTAAITSDQKITSSGITLFSKTLDIAHGSDGKKTLTCSAYINHSRFTSSAQSYSLALVAIPRQASLLTASNFTDEENPTITYSNPAGNTVSVLQAYIYASDDKTVLIDGKNLDKTGTSYTFNLTDAERTTLRNACVNANSCTVKFYIKTVLGGVTYWSNAVNKTLTIVNANPKIITSVKDTNENALTLTGSNQKMIKGYNSIVCNISAETYKGATVKSYSITNGTNVVNSLNTTFANSENNKFVLEVTDSRGNKASDAITLEMIDYVPLTCNVDASIALSTGDSTKAYVKYRVYGNYFNGSLGSVKNELSPIINVVGDETSVKAEVEEVVYDGNTYSITGSVDGLDYENQYAVLAYVSDKLAKNVSNISKRLKAIPVFDWGEEDFNFNVDVFIKKNPIADFVVEQGTDGIWTYRKWYSGVAECWGISETVEANITNGWGNLYSLDDAIPAYSYPFQFVEEPIVTMTPYRGTGANFLVFTGYPSTSSESPTVSLVRPTASTVYAKVHYYVKGKWQ